MFFSTFFYTEMQVMNRDSCYMLTECANQLMLAAECAGLHTRRWWEKRLLFRGIDLSSMVQFTEQTYENLQHDLQRASTAIRANVLFEFHPSIVCELKTPL
jgi:hypothetical protein